MPSAHVLQVFAERRRLTSSREFPEARAWDSTCRIAANPPAAESVSTQPFATPIVGTQDASIT